MSKFGKTNWRNTFVAVAPDCPVTIGTMPPEKKSKSLARYQYEKLYQKDYQYLSDDLLVEIEAERKGMTEEEARAIFFSKSQPCLRTSPLAKRYGFGFHFDENGHVALVPMESSAYQKFLTNPDLTHFQAMASKRK